MRPRLRNVIVLAFLSLVAGCFSIFQGIQGSGVRTKAARTVEAFQELNVFNNMTAEVTIGDDVRVEVEGDDNLVPLVETRVDNGVLNISVKEGYTTKIGLKVLIQTPKLEKVSAANASHVVLHGKLPAIEVTAANAANIDGSDLEVSEAKVNAANASHIVIHATERISGDASNASSVEYVGKCKDVKVQTANASSVNAKSS